MEITRLKLSGFRKFENKAFDFSPAYNVITGRNGSGKTSLFEAVYLLSTGKSFVTNHIQNCIRFGEEYAFLEGEFSGREGESVVRLLIGKNRKEVKFNGVKEKSFSKIIGKLPVIFMNHKLSLIVKGGPENRRTFLNHLLIFSDPMYYGLLLKYYSILYRRNALLKDMGDVQVIRVLTDSMIPVGALIQEKRESITEKLKALTSEMITEITGEKFNVRINYKKSDINRLSDSETFVLEQRRKRTLFGPHLDEIEIFINGAPAREFSSLGEAYSLAFAMRFAENKIISEVKNEPPIIILDDFFSDLDEFHRINILRLARSQQVLISSLSLSLIPQEISKVAKVIVL